MGRLTSEKAKVIAEELRVTRYAATGERAYEHVYGKYKHLFLFDYDYFLKIMQICSLFWACRGEETERDRANTQYIYV